MTWKKASPALIVGAIFDLLRYFFLCFWFFGPALAAVYCSSKVGDVAVVGGLLTKACIGGAVALGLAGGAALIAFGTVMAIAVGFSGWLVVALMILMTDGRVLGENPSSAIWLFEGLGASVCAMAWGVYKAQIKKDKEVLKKYNESQAAAQTQEREQKIAQLMQARAAQQEDAEI